MPGEWEQWRAAFDNQIQCQWMADELKRAALAEDLAVWTSTMTRAVVIACEDRGWSVAAKWNLCKRLPQPGKEYLTIDVTAFPGGAIQEKAAPVWPFPVAVFELENDPGDRRVAYSLWKVMCVRASLRAVIAYRPSWEQGRDLVSQLTAAVIGGLSPDERQAIGGETVLIVGNRGEGQTFPWGYFKCWMLNAGLGRFEKIQ